MYSNLTLFKQYLGIDSADTSKDTLLTMYLNSANSKLNFICWVDSFDLNDYEQNVDVRACVPTPRGVEVYLKNKPVKSIEKINWEDYSWVHWTDYLIVFDRRVIFKRLPISEFWFVSFKYSAWYDRARVVEWQDTPVDDLPDDLKLMEMMLASWMYISQELKGAKSYKLWDEQITFWDVNWMTSDDIFFSFKILLWKYKNFNLPV